MPKARPSQVIVHRIELQEKERELLEELQKSKVTEQYAAAVGKLAIPLAIVGLGGVAYLIGDGIYDFATKHADRIKSSPGGVAISETPEIKRYRTAWESLKKLFGY